MNSHTHHSCRETLVSCDPPNSISIKHIHISFPHTLENITEIKWNNKHQMRTDSCHYQWYVPPHVLKRLHFSFGNLFFVFPSYLNVFLCLFVGVWACVSTGTVSLISLEEFSVNYELNMKGKRMLTKLGTTKLRAIRTFSWKKMWAINISLQISWL